MLQPEGTLRQLMEQLDARVRAQEAELVDFERRAERHIVALKDEISRNKKRLELFRSEMDAMASEQRPTGPFETAPQSSTPESFVQESQSERIRQAAKKILAASAGPLMQGQIKVCLDEMGIEIVAKNVTELVRAALRRHPSEFRHVKGQGWILVDQ